MRDYTPSMYDLSKCVNAFYCYVQLSRTNKKLTKKTSNETISGPGGAVLW